MPLVSVPRDRRLALAPLYEGFVGLHGMIGSLLEGIMGDAVADDLDAPRVARISLDDFHALAGDPDLPVAEEALRSIRDGDSVAVAEAWHERVRRVLPTAEPYSRFAFAGSESWDRAHLASLCAGLPAGFTLSRVTGDTVGAFEGLARSLVCNFDSHADFLTRGVGFAVTTDDGRIVAGCASYAISSHSLEFEIQTHPDYQRRGLALVTGATMIEHCLDNGLEPCWDAAHEGSALLAERLGFVGRRRYTAYYV